MPRTPPPGTAGARRAAERRAYWAAWFLGEWRDVHGDAEVTPADVLRYQPDGAAAVCGRRRPTVGDLGDRLRDFAGPDLGGLTLRPGTAPGTWRVGPADAAAEGAAAEAPPPPARPADPAVRLLREWWASYGGAEVTARLLADVHPAEVGAVCGGKADGRRLGYWLRGGDGRTFCRWVVRGGRRTNGGRRWRLESSA